MSGKKSKSKNPTQAQIAAEIAAKAGLTKAQVNAVFEAALEVAAKHAKAGKAVTLPKIGIKITQVKKAARPAGMRKMFGEMKMVAAKPASKKAKVTAMKKLKEAIA
jgi:nucleoid DNA-binding protein